MILLALLLLVAPAAWADEPVCEPWPAAPIVISNDYIKIVGEGTCDASVLETQPMAGALCTPIGFCTWICPK